MEHFLLLVRDWIFVNSRKHPAGHPPYLTICRRSSRNQLLKDTEQRGSEEEGLPLISTDERGSGDSWEFFDKRCPMPQTGKMVVHWGPISRSKRNSEGKMTKPLSRRTFIKSAAAGSMAILGYDPRVRSWITSAQAQTSSFKSVPKLDGILLFDEASRNAIAVDPLLPSSNRAQCKMSSRWCSTQTSIRLRS